MQLLHSEFPPEISFKFKVLFKHCINSASITNLTFVIGLLCVSEGNHQLYTDKIPQSKHTEFSTADISHRRYITLAGRTQKRTLM